jgi:four helix bundle protein
MSNQILRSSTSVAANYRAACRARSKAEFIAKIGIVIEEADECAFWLELLHESGFIDQQLFHILYNEANELTAIFTATSKSAKIRSRKASSKTQS